MNEKSGKTKDLKTAQDKGAGLQRLVSKPSVDRTYEFCEPDNEIIVTLECGHVETFWLKGLTDQEYIKRARYLKEHAY